MWSRKQAKLVVREPPCVKYAVHSFQLCHYRYPPTMGPWHVCFYTICDLLNISFSLRMSPVVVHAHLPCTYPRCVSSFVWLYQGTYTKLKVIFPDCIEALSKLSKFEFFASTCSSPLSSTFCQRNKAEIITVWNESNFHVNHCVP